MRMIRKFIEDYKLARARALAEICDRVAVIDGRGYVVFFKRSLFLGRIEGTQLVKLPAAFTRRGHPGDATQEEARRALRGDYDRRHNPLDELNF